MKGRGEAGREETTSKGEGRGGDSKYNEYIEPMTTAIPGRCRFIYER